MLLNKYVLCFCKIFDSIFWEYYQKADLLTRLLLNLAEEMFIVYAQL